jgi:catechol 1,2-dioxygenase
MYGHPEAQKLLAKVKSLGGGVPNPRVREAVDRLLDVLFPLIVDLRLTEDEWDALIAHLDRTGAEGQFAVTAWLLGLSQLVQDMNSPLRETATEHTILGPFYKEGAPLLANDAPLYKALHDQDEYLLMRGRVLDDKGRPLAGVEVDAWGANGLGMYSFWDEDQPPYNLRGRVKTDAQGRYAIRTVYPRPYAIPPFLAPGAMLEALGRQAWRPSHLHFRIVADGLVPLVTQVYLAESDFMQIDSAVAVKDSLITTSRRQAAPAAIEAEGLDRPFHEVAFDFRLQPAAAAAAAE